MLAPQFSAAPRTLACEETGFAEPLGPVGNQRAVGRTGHRAFVHTPLTAQNRRYEVAALPGAVTITGKAIQRRHSGPCREPTQELRLRTRKRTYSRGPRAPAPARRPEPPPNRQCPRRLRRPGREFNAYRLVPFSEILSTPSGPLLGFKRHAVSRNFAAYFENHVRGSHRRVPAQIHFDFRRKPAQFHSAAHRAHRRRFWNQIMLPCDSLQCSVGVTRIPAIRLPPGFPSNDRLANSVDMVERNLHSSTLTILCATRRHRRHAAVATRRRHDASNRH